MARAIWKGVLSFAVVSVPVKLYTAVRPARVAFHLLHDEDRTRLRQQMVCPLEEAPVPGEHAIKGFAVDEERYVLVTPEELAALEPESSRTIDVQEFVPAVEIDPRYYDRPYYLGPDDGGGKYAALAQSLERSGRVGICRWTMRKRSYIGALKPRDGLLRLVTLRYAEEVVPVESLTVPEARLDEREIRTARYLMDSLAASFKPEAYQDEFQARLRDLIARKARGEEIRPKRARAPKATGSDQLLKALEASVAQAKKRGETHAAA